MTFINALKMARVSREMQDPHSLTCLALTVQQWHALKTEMATYQPAVEYSSGDPHFMGLQVLIAAEGEPLTAPPKEVLDIRTPKAWKKPAFVGDLWFGSGGSSAKVYDGATWIPIGTTGATTVITGGGGGGGKSTYLSSGGGAGGTVFVKYSSLST